MANLLEKIGLGDMTFGMLIRRAVLGFFGLTIGIVVFYRFVPPPITLLQIIRCGEQIGDGKSLKLHKDWVPLSEISPNMPFAVMMTEDQTFTTHHGFNFEAIEKALKSNAKRKKRGKPVRGGSTISQQVAKNVFLWPARSWVRKGLEAYFTLLIEVLWGKERIMEVYLNVIEMGDGVYGIEAASQAYFGVSASRLSKEQAAAIAGILPNPRKYKVNSGYTQRVKSFALSQMAMWGGVCPLKY